MLGVSEQEALDAEGFTISETDRLKILPGGTAEPLR